MKYHPKNDGIDHINAYSKGLTELGRLLTNFAHTPFEHPKYGRFASVEAAWYFAKTGFVFDELKNKSGYEAKKLGKSLLKTMGDFKDNDSELPENFIIFIKECIGCKLRQNVKILNMLVDSNLPIVHYYYYGDVNKEPKIKYLNKYEWQIEYIRDIRLICQNHLRDRKKKGFKQSSKFI